MTYKINFLGITLVFRYSIIWLAFYLFLVIYEGSNDMLWMLRTSNLVLGICLGPLLILLFQYILYSLKRTIIDDNQLYIGGELVDYRLVRIVKYQSTNKPNNNIPYLPWMAGAFYFYKIYFDNGKTYYVTCLMDRRKESFESAINKLGIELTTRNEFYPWLR